MNPRRDSEKSYKVGFLARHGYTLCDTIGLGNYAKVKQARDRNHNRNVAIKIVDKLRTPQDYLEKFLPREINYLKKLKHKNLTEILKVLENDLYLFVVLELADGGDLLEYMRARRMLSERSSRHFFRQICSGMKYCHNQGIVHRDLKCENILLCFDQTVKICDFGFATKMGKGMFLTTFCGSVAYAPPEVLEGQPYDGFKADVWSMGVILYAMVYGTLPFDDHRVKRQIAQMYSREHPKYKPIRPRNEEVSKSKNTVSCTECRFSVLV
jgi:serine kinase